MQGRKVEMNKKTYFGRLAEICDSMALANGVMNAGLAMCRRKNK